MRVAFLHPWVLALVLALAGAFPGAPTAAAAQDSAPGTEGAVPWEALVLDPAGARLLGHGLSDVGKLVLELGATFERFVLVGRDRFVAQVAAGSHERAADLTQQQVMQRRVG